VIEFYEPTAEEKRVTLDYRRMASGSIELQGDRNLLFEALANLVENAIKFAPEEGNVSVDLFRDTAGFGITIADDGPGIAPDERQAVLRRFYRGEASRHTPGNGLGLSLTHAVAGMHDMSIRFNDVQTGCSVTLFRNARPAIMRTAD